MYLITKDSTATFARRRDKKSTPCEEVAGRYYDHREVSGQEGASTAHNFAFTPSRITFLPFQDTYLVNNNMKQTPNRLTNLSSSDSDSNSDSDTSERSNHPRVADLNNVSSLLGSAVAGSPVGNIFRKLGSRPPSPMTREKLQAVLQKALDVINEEIDDSELDFGQGAKR
jgi:hypothetical protein